jgi:hypothetical protein
MTARIEELEQQLLNEEALTESLFATIEKKQLEICDLERKLSVAAYREAKDYSELLDEMNSLQKYLNNDPNMLEIRMSIGDYRYARSLWVGCIEQAVNKEGVIKEEACAMFNKLWDMHKGEKNV